MNKATYTKILFNKLITHENLAFFLILLVLFLLLPRSGVHELGDNTVMYMDDGIRYLNGQSPALALYRGPGFPLILSIFFALFGVSVKSAFFAIRLVHVGVTLAAFFLTKRFFGIRAAIICAFLTITSWPLDALSVWIMPDLPATLFLLLSILFIYDAYEKKQWFKATMAGFFMGLAFLTKEYVVLFFMLPLLILFKKDYRNRSCLMVLGLFYLAVSLIILPWAYYLIKIKSYPVHSLLGMLSPAAKGQWIGKGTFIDALGFILKSIFIDGISGIKNFLLIYFKQYFVLYPIIVISWIYIVFAFFREKKAKYLLLILSVLLFSPVLIALGLYDMGTRQGTFFYYLSYVALSGFLVFLSYSIFSLLKRIPKIKPTVILLLLAAILAGYQIFNGKRSTYALWKNGAKLESAKTFPVTSWSMNDFEVIGAHRSEIAEACAWIRANIHRGSKANIAIRYKQGMNLFLGFNYFSEIPGANDYWNTQIEEFLEIGELRANDKVLAIWPYSNFRSRQKRHRSVQFLVYRSFEKIFREADYFLFTRTPFFDKWLSELTFLEIIYENSYVQIYKINQKEYGLISFQEQIIKNYNEKHQKIYVNWRLKDDLAWLKENYPLEYDDLIFAFSKLNIDLEAATEKGIIW